MLIENVQWLAEKNKELLEERWERGQTNDNRSIWRFTYRLVWLQMISQRENNNLLPIDFFYQIN